MDITLTIPNEQVTRVLNAFATYYGYQEQISVEVDDMITMIPNPQSKGQFAKERLVYHIKSVVREVEKQEAIKSIAVSEVDVT